MGGLVCVWVCYVCACVCVGVCVRPQGHSVNALTIDHVSPLHEACVGNHVACARALIDAGANVSPHKHICFKGNVHFHR